MSDYFQRRIKTAEVDLFLDQLFLSRGIRPQSFPGGLLAIDKTGEPVIRLLHLPNEETMIYFYVSHFKEPV